MESGQSRNWVVRYGLGLEVGGRHLRKPKELGRIARAAISTRSAVAASSPAQTE
jgi:hypothetical protein